ncbi:hypothetical protein TNCV_1355021 [Trichonephila clavipes]|uniref:Uncharacterized protein n=1 Tax=Trichonephila clavipes TaxID=2585209 RepID=A0A8X6S9C2_TRICX|nr:hypothetical protein TNCV_1355021 [Trichonephila clavipes]
MATLFQPTQEVKREGKMQNRKLNIRSLDLVLPCAIRFLISSPSTTEDSLCGRDWCTSNLSWLRVITLWDREVWELGDFNTLPQLINRWDGPMVTSEQPWTRRFLLARDLVNVLARARAEHLPYQGRSVQYRKHEVVHYPAETLGFAELE